MKKVSILLIICILVLLTLYGCVGQKISGTWKVLGIQGDWHFTNSSIVVTRQLFGLSIPEGHRPRLAGINVENPDVFSDIIIAQGSYLINSNIIEIFWEVVLDIPLVTDEYYGTVVYNISQKAGDTMTFEGDINSETLQLTRHQRNAKYPPLRSSDRTLPGYIDLRND